MAFKSIGQKYGFVSAGDVYRQRIADAEAKAQKQIEAERQKAEVERAKNRDDTAAVLREMGISDAQIAEMQARLDAMRNEYRWKPL